MDFTSYLKNEIFLKDDTLITSKTDLKGGITYANRDFMELGGYREKEFLHKAHNIVRHPFMPKAAFRLLWDTISHKKEFFAFVCNLSKYKQTYWVFANVTPSFDENGNVISYYSVRRRPSKEGVEAIVGIYKQLLEIEKSSDLDSSVAFVQDFLKQNAISWDELMVSLQNKGKNGGYR